MARTRSSRATLDLTWRAFSTSTVFLTGRGVNQVDDAPVSLFSQKTRELWQAHVSLTYCNVVLHEYKSLSG